MMGQRLANGNLLIPMRAESDGIVGDGIVEIGPDHEQYAAWDAYLPALEASEDSFLFHLPGKHNQKDHGRGRGAQSGISGDAGAREIGKPGRAGSRGEKIRQRLDMVAAEKAGLEAQRASLKAAAAEITARQERGEITMLEAQEALAPIASQRAMVGSMDRALTQQTYASLAAENPIGKPRMQMMSEDYDTLEPSMTMDLAGDFVGSVVDRGAIPADVTEVGMNVRLKSGRAEAQGMWIRVDEFAPASTVIHEYGHVLESANADMLARSISWRNERTKGDAEIPMSEATGNPQYRANEKTKVDAFTSPYIGKNYGLGASEVVSMGLEALYSDPIGFAQADPDMFDFVIDQIQPSRGE